MNASVPTIIHPLLRRYLDQVNQQLPGLLHGFYLEGSIALGGFNERFSDIDFMALLTRPATPADIRILKKIHQEIERTYRFRMSGTYFLLAPFFTWKEPLTSQLHFHEGVLRLLHQSFEPNSVEGWILKHHGITLFGPDIRSLPFTVDWDVLIQRMQENLNVYWTKWTRSPYRLVIMLSDWGVQWTVLGVLRQFYSFREGAITTKISAGEYALNCLPPRWHPLVEEAIAIRQYGQPSWYPLHPYRMMEAVRFLTYIIQTCNTGFS